jgi:cytochrome c oxidase subunit 3
MEGIHGGNLVGQSASRAGLYLFLAVITSLFLLFTISHHMRSGYPDWLSVVEPNILWFNTLVLVLASVALQLARNAARRGQHAATRRRLAWGSALTLVFIAGQAVAWKEMLDAGFYAAENPANAFFYMFTAVHALHLVGGLWFLLRAVGWSITAPEDDRLPVRVELCATYWHYLLLVWFLLFYLLLST